MFAGMAVGAGVEFPFAAGDGLVVKVEIASLGLIPGRFFPTFELGGIQLGRERRPVGASRWWRRWTRAGPAIKRLFRGARHRRLRRQ